MGTGHIRKRQRLQISVVGIAVKKEENINSCIAFLLAGYPQPATGKPLMRVHQGGFKMFRV
jgi:hypothetical protein